MQNIFWKIGFIIVLVGVCLWSLNPPQEKIRLGKDLRGGVSLIYSVRIDSSVEDPQAVLTQVITVLKDRVDPNGLLNISMQPLGRDRIEIVSPLPNKRVRALRRDYDAALEVLLADAQIHVGELDTAIRLQQATVRYGSEGDLGEKIVELQEFYDVYQAAREALVQAPDAIEASELARLEDAVAKADIGYEEGHAAVLRLSLERSRVVRTLNLPGTRESLRDDKGKVLTDPQTGEPLTKPSQRDVAMSKLRGEFPHLSDALDAVTAAFADYQKKRKGFDDPQDLIRLLRGAGVLEFRIAVQTARPEGINPDDLRQQLIERGPDSIDSMVARWYPINDLKQWYDGLDELAALERDPRSFFAAGRGLVAEAYEGQHYLLLYTGARKSMTHKGDRAWSLESARRSVDQLGRPAVEFRLDTPGGALMGRLTGPHVGHPMAIVLDGQVFSAPTLQSQIQNTGIITGNFSQSEISYLIRVLAAGSLEARLSKDPIAINILGPSLGEDNLRRGRDACIIAIIAVALFMAAYYFFAGMVANLALLINGVIIFGVMAMIDGTFTLPGLGGIVLTIGMAVDANVLIYERIREELFTGETDLRGAIREGYRKAFSTIIDANVTNLIICQVLIQTATTEVRGFAVTLTIGILATLFTSLFVTRVIYTLYTDGAKFKRLPMLATVFPGIHRALEPNINWIGLRKFFWTVSLIGVVASIALVSTRGVEMFDTEFRGGVSVTMATAPIGDDPVPAGEPERLWLAHIGPQGVETRIHQIGRTLDEPGAASEAARQRAVELLQHLFSTDPGSTVHDLTAADLPAQLPGARLSNPEVDSLVTVLTELRNASVLTVGETQTDDAGVVVANRFQVKVASPKGIGDEDTITNAIVGAIVWEFGDQLDVTPPLTFVGAGSDEHAPFTFTVEKDTLGECINRPQYTDRVIGFKGGVAVVIDEIDPPVTPDDVAKRIDRMRSQRDFAQRGALGRDVKVIGLEPVEPTDLSRGYRSVAVLVFDRDLSSLTQRVSLETWDERLARTEWELVSQSLQVPPALDAVTGFSSAVAQTLAASAIVAVGLSLLGILVYIWVRFGSLRYSLAAIIALLHDVTIALGLLALTGLIGKSAFAETLLIEEFRIDLGVVAAMLTIIGYSLNDTIVILDRIRENRGKLLIPTAAIVNRSINQTMSRTLLTSTTTLLAVVIMYIQGGSGIRSFTFCLLVGLIVGTYSSVAIAAPLLIKWGGDGGPLREETEPV